MKLILLDRDGVINQDRADYVKTPEELVLFPQALQALQLLEARGIKVGICTNQAGIEKGIYSEEDLSAIHQKMQKEVKKNGGGELKIEYCSSADDNHPMRKPNPGMLIKQMKNFALTSLKNVPYIGDDYKDIQVAKRAGAIPMLVGTGKGYKTKEKYAKELENIAFFPDLLTAVEYLLASGFYKDN
ncbi:MAG: HAD-IIIA family hydrolase [Cardiobacteriaceae bacterium]|nr:HAD-IIIA family hydrolase [Cardiobacteriaceae bacterium]